MLCDVDYNWKKKYSTIKRPPRLLPSNSLYRSHICIDGSGTVWLPQIPDSFWKLVMGEEEWVGQISCLVERTENPQSIVCLRIICTQFSRLLESVDLLMTWRGNWIEPKKIHASHSGCRVNDHCP